MTNRFLASLPSSARAELEPHLEEAPLNTGAVLHSLGGSIDYVYFPHSGLISTIITMQSGRTAETGMTGRDGLLGSAVVLDVSDAIDQATVEIPGKAARIKTAQFIRAYRQCEPLRTIVNWYHAVMIAETQQSAACNALHNMEERLCRWILEAHDRTGLEEPPLTQEFLANMLGVQRTSVSLVQHKLAAARLTATRRGMITIENMQGLRECSCECYELLKERAATILPGWRSRNSSWPSTPYSSATG